MWGAPVIPVTDEFKRKVDYLVNKISNEIKQKLYDEGHDSLLSMGYGVVTAEYRQKYVLIKVAKQSNYMIEKETGRIFGTKAYDTINRVRPYKTLDDVDDYYWGDYHPQLLSTRRIAKGKAQIRKEVAPLSDLKARVKDLL
jgi:hypothetical protein